MKKYLAGIILLVMCLTTEPLSRIFLRDAVITIRSEMLYRMDTVKPRCSLARIVFRPESRL